MSLKVEQRLLGCQVSELEPRVYAQGVYLVPMQVAINGQKMWVWVADEFDEEVYFNSNNASANVLADTIKNLLNQE